MTDQQPMRPRQGDYRVAVENFGPIVRAGIDVRPLTIFVGPSNTGKSYLAILLYVLHRCFGGADPYSYGTVFSRRRVWAFDSSDVPRRRRRPIYESLNEWASVLSSSETPQELPSDVAGYLHSVLQAAEGLEGSVSYEIRRCFGIDNANNLVRRAGSDALARICLSVPYQDSEARYDIELDSSGSRLAGHFPRVTSLPHGEGSDDSVRATRTVQRELRNMFAHGSSTFVHERVLRLLMDSVASSVLGPLYRNAYYLPADRTGVMHSHQVVVSTIVQSAATTGLRPSPDVPMLSGVLTDFLDQLIGISGRKRGRQGRSRSGGADLAGLLERNVLEGTVVMERGETGYPTFAYRPRGWREDIALMRASSMVSELAPVVLYLRYLVRSGDVLIIEEPEAHLHPAMQAAFARELARLVRAGVRIVMTTHSEWFLEQIGNLVRLATLPKKKQAGIPGAEVALDSSEVGAWLFRRSGRPKGSIVEEVELDPQTGLFRTGYDAVSDALYNESAEIFNRLNEGVE
ncbi:MAG: AAA family ATPase [Acidobacteria bacterium]|nr:AAA family ATPase [Acidobacteriota bacterium]